ncbi:MAG: bifunctional hydroxymethylpyrimidine kinase/phosphomethylpyrimidine kinase [Bauldia sp.]|uniref:bifunctional hydroxymethylpyrimidine kinase/phosphomethylpyrimidine kinase n=1 Tax=Bauldia sp. TaxID=2575872 RepID=UPI001D9C3721|nr:bifunctional hydroxymethylpyrimidine kinase/phosphomethylpyrimidine kinase [Bauldia sp.]MCB1495715.1 bifunctional hydroxymethylpyrimidine kinase/phosphomethylpyrimidine kinase [Bauldia sp.]
MIANVLSIAGTDPSGGAGIMADLKTFGALGAYGMAAITAVVAQNTRGVTGFRVVEPDVLTAQIDAVFDDVRVDAVKIGMVATAEIATAIADALTRHGAKHVVLDPVMVAKSGDRLLAAEAVAAVRDRLLPLAEIITPNLPEAADLLGTEEPSGLAAAIEVAGELKALGPASVLLKGGHGGGPDSTDIYFDGDTLETFTAPRITTKNTHGTGCTLSAALAALLPTMPRLAAIARAKDYVTGAIAASDRLSVGHGHGPLNHFHEVWPAE